MTNDLTTELSEKLWNKTFPCEHAKYSEFILEQYKIYLEMADKISNRRDSANNYFLSLNGAFLGTVGILFDKGYLTDLRLGLLLPLIFLLVECFLWWRIITSYKQLNGAKFAIIGELESKLPASPYGKGEWELLLQKGNNKKAYLPLTHIESKIPILFGVTYLLLAAYIIFDNLKLFICTG